VSLARLTNTYGSAKDYFTHFAIWAFHSSMISGNLVENPGDF
jgi:hypothetical protein